MNVEKPKDTRLRISEGVQHRADFERTILRQINYKLHTNGPIVPTTASRHAEMFVDLSADRTNRAIADDGERRSNIHTRHKAIGGVAVFVRTLIDQPHAHNAIVFNERT